MPERLAPIVDSGRRKPVARTLKQAFPQSEGYRLAIEDPAGRLIPLDGSIAARRWVSMDRVCWVIVIGAAAWVLRWAWLAPKGLG